jgi:cyclophilin family peptidyl-prolyl cis-trans isomerase
MSNQPPSAVDRWQEPLDLKKFREAEARRRKHLLVAWLVVALVSLAMVGVGLMGGKEANSEAEAHVHGVDEAAKAAINGTAAALPTDPDEIKKLLSNPTNPVIRIDTGQGDMLVELYEDKVPNTVANMIELAEKGFYKGMRFHRVIKGFMAQGGCPFSKRGAVGVPGTGDPGYRFADEFSPDLKHDSRGILSMANSGPGTNGSQFFICFRAQPMLDNKHAVFGKVVAGMDTLDKIERLGMADDPGTPSQTIRFNIEVVLKQDHEYHVKTL